MTITLRRQGTNWVAIHSGDGADEIVLLFGTATIPTPYHRHIAPDIVMAKVQELNPDAVVLVEA